MLKPGYIVNIFNNAAVAITTNWLLSDTIPHPYFDKVSSHFLAVYFYVIKAVWYAVTAFSEWGMAYTSR